MHDWNVVVSVREGGFAEARKVLRKLGPIDKTEFFNILVMKVDEIPRFMEELGEQAVENAHLQSIIARIIPVNETFDFQRPEELESKAKKVALRWASQLAGKRFHVRMHRRGFKGRISSREEEQKLSEVLLDHLEKSGSPGLITFDDPDAVIALEMVGQRAGLSIWTREQLAQHPFLQLET